MRTLKKTLSLVLVVAMVLGLCVVGASAYNKVEDFTDDVAKIGDAYYEAVGVLTGIQVIDGMTETSFQPQGNYTREQAAKIIAYMMLGKADADSLRCTKAPFDDVAADRWSAGYIAFCVEQGIIDGMTETTFEPTGTLTGFQWAKMLLCAVGFGVKGEFTGSSWSLNTSKYAHNVDLFAGDLAGADHTAITREQAALYAFNVLTAVDLVVYSESLGDYIKGYNSWFVDRYTPQGTLAETVFKLDNVVGIVVDNEGMGASATYVDSVVASEGTVKVAAKTDLNLMYHAARVWYVAGKTNTGVFTYDLAKVETTNCPSTATVAALKAPVSIGNSLNGSVPYQLDVVDNSAIGAGKTSVVFYYKLGSRGPVSNADKTTVIDTAKYQNAKILTDISKVAYLDPVIYIYTHSVKEAGDADAYAVHAYSPTATTGVVSKIANDGTITLRDGTVIGKSNLASASLGYFDIGHSYTFMLDTHGHYYGTAENLTLVYYTGAYERVSGSYVGEEVYNVQVADVQTGVATNVRVNGAWKNNVNGPVVDTVNMTAGYYWLGEPNLSGVYTLQPWSPYDYNTDGGYVHSDSATFRASTGVQVMPGVDSRNVGNVYYTAGSVKFVIASGRGSTYSYATYNSVAELLAGYNATGATTGSVTLADMALTTVRTTVGNVDTTIVFAYDVTATSRYVFVPYDIPASEWTSMGEIANGSILYYYEKGAYLNGELITIFSGAPTALERGFYSVTVNALGYTVLRDAFPGQWFYETENVVKSGNNYAQEFNGKLRQFASDAKIYDFRKGVLASKLDAITALELFNYYNEPNLQLAYTVNAAGEIDVCYVVEENLGIVTVDKGASWAEASKWTVTSAKCVSGGLHQYEDDVTFTMVPTGITLTKGAKLDVYVNVEINDGAVESKAFKAEGVVGDNNVVTVNFSISKAGIGGNYWYGVTVTDVVFPDFTVNLADYAMDKFDLWVGVNGKEVEAEGNTYTVKMLAPGESFKIGFERESAKNLVAMALVTGMPEDSYAVTFNGVGVGAWITEYVPTIVTDINVTDIVATYELALNAADDVLSTGDSTADFFSIDVVTPVGPAAANETLKSVTAGDSFNVYLKHDGLANEANSNVASVTFGTAATAVTSQESVSQAFANNSTFSFLNVLPSATVSGVTNEVVVSFVNWVQPD